MRVIVELFKYIIGITFLLCCYGISFVFGLAVSFTWNGGNDLLMSALAIYWSLVAFIVLVIATGISAILISVHDRLVNLVIAVQERNSAEQA